MELCGETTTYTLVDIHYLSLCVISLLYYTIYHYVLSPFYITLFIITLYLPFTLQYLSVRFISLVTLQYLSLSFISLLHYTIYQYALSLLLHYNSYHTSWSPLTIVFFVIVNTSHMKTPHQELQTYVHTLTYLHDVNITVSIVSVYLLFICNIL